MQLQEARSLPRIHDISTDTENPPVFVDILAKRRDAPNSASYGGPHLVGFGKGAFHFVLSGLEFDMSRHSVHAGSEGIAVQPNVIVLACTLSMHRAGRHIKFPGCLLEAPVARCGLKSPQGMQGWQIVSRGSV